MQDIEQNRVVPIESLPVPALLKHAGYVSAGLYNLHLPIVIVDALGGQQRYERRLTTTVEATLHGTDEITGLSRRAIPVFTSTGIRLSLPLLTERSSRITLTLKSGKGKTIQARLSELEASSALTQSAEGIQIDLSAILPVAAATYSLNLSLRNSAVISCPATVWSSSGSHSHSTRFNRRLLSSTVASRCTPTCCFRPDIY